MYVSISAVSMDESESDKWMNLMNVDSWTSPSFIYRYINRYVKSKNWIKFA